MGSSKGSTGINNYMKLHDIDTTQRLDEGLIQDIWKWVKRGIVTYVGYKIFSSIFGKTKKKANNIDNDVIFYTILSSTIVAKRSKERDVIGLAESIGEGFKTNVGIDEYDIVVKRYTGSIANDIANEYDIDTRKYSIYGLNITLLYTDRSMKREIEREIQRIYKRSGVIITVSKHGKV